MTPLSIDPWLQLPHLFSTKFDRAFSYMPRMMRTFLFAPRISSSPGDDDPEGCDDDRRHQHRHRHHRHALEHLREDAIAESTVSPRISQRRNVVNAGGGAVVAGGSAVGARGGAMVAAFDHSLTLTRILTTATLISVVSTMVTKIGFSIEADPTSLALDFIGPMFMARATTTTTTTTTTRACPLVLHISLLPGAKLNGRKIRIERVHLYRSARRIAGGGGSG